MWLVPALLLALSESSGGLLVQQQQQQQQQQRQQQQQQQQLPQQPQQLLQLPASVAGANIGVASNAPLGNGHYAPGELDVYYTAEMLDKLSGYLKKINSSMETRYDLEKQRLTAAAQVTPPNSTDRAALQDALKRSEASRAESMAASVEMLQFYYAVKAMMGSKSAAPSCQFLTCGRHATCVEKGGQALCRCEPCFKGDGFICSPTRCGPVTDFSAQPLLGQPPIGYPVVPQTTPRGVVELQLVAFSSDKLAVAVRDSHQGNRGFLIVGQAGSTEIVWGTWKEFSGGVKTFGIALAGFPNGRLAIAFRDADRSGTGYLMAGFLNNTRKLALKYVRPQAFAKNQAQHATLVPLASSRVACLYSEHASDSAKTQPFGGMALVQVGVGGHLKTLGKYRFSNGELVTRITATPLSPSSFVVAYRVVPGAAAPPGEPSKELSALWVGMHGTELMVDPHPVTLEPDRVNMWARSVALVSQNLIAYSYESSTEKATKLVTLRVNPKTHRLTVADGPHLISKGGTSFVHAVSLPSGSASPKTFTYLQKPGETSTAQVCRISPQGSITSCQEVPWADAELKAVSGVRLPDGRLAFAFATMNGAPQYQILGPEESGAED